MASEADTRHGPLGILLAQARAEKITCKFCVENGRVKPSYAEFKLATPPPGASPPRTCVLGGEAAVGSRSASTR